MMFAPARHGSRTKMQHCASGLVQGSVLGGNLNLAGGKKLDGYDARSQNWSGHGAKLGMTGPDSCSRSTLKPGQDTSGHRIRLHHSADLIGRSATEEHCGRWNTAHRLEASTYKRSPSALDRKQAQKALGNCGGKASNVDDAASFKGGHPSPRQSPSRSPRTVDATASFKAGRPSFRHSPRQSPRTPPKKSIGSHVAPKSSTKRLLRCESDCTGLSSQACDGSNAKNNHPPSGSRRCAAQPIADLHGLQVPKSSSGAPARPPQQDVAKTLSCKAIPDEGSCPASAVVRSGSPTSIVPRIVGISSFSNLGKAVSDQTSARSLGMASVRSTEVRSACNRFSYQSRVAQTQAQRSKQAIAPSPDATYPELPSARNHCSFLERVLGKGRILHKGGGRLTQGPRGPRYSCDEPEYQLLDENCKDGKDTETTASSCRDPEELVEIVNLFELGQDSPVLTSVASGVLSDVESHEAPLPSASQYQRLDWDNLNHKDMETIANSDQDFEERAKLEKPRQSVVLSRIANDASPQECNALQEAPLHSASCWLSFIDRPDEDSVSEDLPDSPRSFKQCVNDDTIVWDHQGFPVTPSHLWLNQEQ